MMRWGDESTPISWWELTAHVVWTLVVLSVGIGIGSTHTAGLAVRDYEDARYYHDVAEDLAEALGQCAATLERSVDVAATSSKTLRAYLGRRVVIEEVSP